MTIALVGSMSLSSCGKYEEGPGISLKSPTSRIATTWEVEKYIDADGTETAGDDNDPTITYTKDGEFTVTQGNTNYSGTWEFSGDVDLRTETTIFGFTTVSTVEILRLSSKELWTKDDDGDVIHFKVK